MKKLNSTTYEYATAIASYAQPKVIETHDGFLLNTVYHNDKKALNATTQQIYNNVSTVTGLQRYMILERMTSNEPMSYGFSKNSIITDKYNENTYYSFSGEGQSNANNNFCYCLKYTEENGIVTYVKGTWSGLSIGQYLGQSENFLYFSYGNLSVNGNSNKIIYKMNKETLVITSAYTYYSYYPSNVSYNSSSSYHPIVLKETALSIYMLVLSTNSASTFAIKPIIVKIDKVNETVTALVTLANFTCGAAGQFICQAVHDCIEINETTFGVIFKTPNNTTATTDYFSYVQVDISDEENVTATVSSMPVDNLTLPTNSYYTYAAPQNIWIYEYEDKQYLYAFRTHYSAADASTGVAYNCLYAFEIEKDENNVPVQLKFISKQEGSTWRNKATHNMMLSKDKSVLILTNSSQYIGIYRFDATTCDYQYVNELNIANKYYRYGLDSLNRLWIVDQKYNVEVYGLNDYSSYSLEFEKAEYAYEGTDIETYVKFRCLDLTKSRVNGTFKLTIQGAAKFVENYDTSLTVTLNEDDTEDLQVPILITGGGRIIIYPTLLSS